MNKIEITLYKIITFLACLGIFNTVYVGYNQGWVCKWLNSHQLGIVGVLINVIGSFMISYAAYLVYFKDYIKSLK